MLKLIIHSKDTDLVAGTSPKTGKAYSFRTQKAYLQSPLEPYPKEIQLTLNDNALPSDPGIYDLDVENSVYADRNGRIAIRPVLNIASKQPLPK